MMIEDALAEEGNYEDATGDGDSERRVKTPSSLDDVEAKLKALKLKYSSNNPNNPNVNNAVKLYLHVGGNTPKAKWVTSDKLTTYSFVKTNRLDGHSDGEDDGDGDEDDEKSPRVLMVGSKIRSKVALEMQLKTFADQRRVDFVASGVWAMKFCTEQDYNAFVTQFQNRMFENTHEAEATEENRGKVYGMATE